MLPHLQLDLLTCPVTGGPLEWLADDRLRALQQAIAAAAVVNRAGDLVTDLPQGALVCQAAGLAYPLVRGIPLLTPGQAIEMAQVVTTDR